MLEWSEKVLTIEEEGGNGHRPELASTSTEAAATQAAPTGVRPTLLICLGGTGQRIGVYTKAMFIANHGRIPDWFRLLVFDTANEPYAVRLEDGQTVTLEPGTEFINIGHVPVGRIIRHRQKQRAIAERFGDSLLQLPPTVLRHGAKQVRLLGLLALYWHFHTIEEHIKRALWRLAGRETGRKAVVDTEQGVNIFVVNSLCGGTGAGEFIDVAFNVRAQVEELGDLGDFCQITGVGVLPGAFHDVDGPNLLPNTVASLLELNHVMTRNDFRAVYPNGRVIEPTSAPFNLYYVIDGVDERGRVWPGINAVCRLAAQALYLQIGSQVGRKGENDFDNLDEVLGGVDGNAGTFLGSVGLSICQFDAAAARDLCARRQAVRLIRDGWLRPEDGESASQRAVAFWEVERLEPESLMDGLAVDDESVAVGVNLSLPGRIHRLSLAQQAQETVAYVEGYRTARLESTFRTAIERRRRERIAAVTEGLRRQVVRLTCDPETGVQEAIAVVSSLKGLFDRGRAELQAQMAELENQVEQSDREMSHQRAALLRTASGGFLMRGGKVATAQRRYLQAATTAYRTHLSLVLCDAALQVLNNLERSRSELANDLNRMASRLHDAVRLLESSPGRSGDGLPPDLDLATPDYVTKLYTRYAPTLGDTAALCLEGLDGEDGLLRWADRPAAELVQWVSKNSARSFDPVLRHDVETALREQSDGVSPGARLRQQMQQATPSWNLDRARLEDGGAGLVSVTVLGVPDEHKTLFADQGGMLVSTQDNQQIVALRATVGAPYTALQQFPAWKRAYDQMRGQRPLHILPAFHTSTEAALHAFALGLVFRLIFAQGSWYYYRSVDRLDKPKRLAQGLQNAVQVFAAREGMAHEVLERVEQHILVHLTTEEAIKRLDAYWQAGEQGGVADELDRRLRKAARSYADRLRQTLAASEGILEEE
jgi:hypothetical protein